MKELLSNKYFIYFLGYLWADGHVSPDKKQVVLAINRKDADNIRPIFEKFEKLLDKPFTFHYDRPPKNTNWSQMARFYSSSNKLYDFLKSNDFHKKSNCQPTKIIRKIPLELKHYFYLGYIDGDGCFSASLKNCMYQFSISGPFDYQWNFMKKLFNELNIKYKINRYKRQKGSNSSIWIIGMHEVSKIGDFIYKDSSMICLERKRDKFNYIKGRSLIPVSKHKRVFFNNTIKKYCSYLRINGKMVSLGRYETENEAINARKLGDRILEKLSKFKAI